MVLGFLVTTTLWLAPQDAEPILLPDMPELSVPLFDRWRDYITPSEEELSFESIAWMVDFASGLKRAAEEGKPLLFWAMNGHPLGCT